MTRPLQIGGGYHRYSEIDFLKGISILAIVIMHYIQNYVIGIPEIVLKASSFGGAGVHVFMLCSGFGLALAQNAAMDWFAFFKKRFFKIYIPYVIVVIVSALIPYMYSGEDRLVAVLSHVLLFKMFFEQYESNFGIQFWFISTIFQLYLIYPLLVLVKRRYGSKKFFLFCLVLSISWWIIVPATGHSGIRVWDSFFLQYLWEFALGICLADYLKQSEEMSVCISNISLLIVGMGCLVVYGIMGYFGGFFKAFNDPFSLGFIAAISLLLFQIGVLKNFVLKVSEVSYELYLVHMVVAKIVFVTLGRIATPSLLSGIGVAILVLFLSLLVSKGYSELMKRLSKKLKV